MCSIVADQAAVLKKSGSAEDILLYESLAASVDGHLTGPFDCCYTPATCTDAYILVENAATAVTVL